uniref:Uncharacterized protein n=1 Tax=Oscillatoriales cyanobacterium SpSt-402 TaxID=2282168 RepID=A0A832H3M7_9CYAN
MSDRLDRIEAILERIAEKQEETQQQINSNARAIEANSNAIVELRLSLREEVESMVGMIAYLAEQAEQDRVEFRAAVQQAQDGLHRRFSGNGHGDTNP